MKKFFWLFCFVLTGAFLVPGSLFAYHSYNYYYVDDSDNMCKKCHPGTPVFNEPCTPCHTATAPPYSVQVAPLMRNHSNENLGTNYSQMESWNIGQQGPYPLKCGNCHDPHRNNGIFKKGGITNPDYKLVEFTGICTANVNGITTMSISNLVINDPAWTNPASWVAKTGAERGLTLVYTTGDGQTWWHKVVSATNTEISFKSEHFPQFNPNFPKATAVSLVYGQLIRDKVGYFNGDIIGGIHVVDGNLVTFGGPGDMAIDDDLNPEDGFDESPNGICQVCHTQTTHWTKDGEGANHFSGWRCTICHPHELGFKAAPPLLCP